MYDKCRKMTQTQALLEVEESKLQDSPSIDFAAKKLQNNFELKNIQRSLRVIVR